MYSLYRAWFGAEENYPRLETLSPPDTVVRVGNDGEYHFVAHRTVLAAHSGYLKALLATTASALNADSSSTGESTPPVITVPSTIGGEAFAPLLNYMYTGRLEVTLDNIYTVLLATHLLHMPGALEQCRAALLRLRAGPSVPPMGSSAPSAQQTSSVLRPVPNRLLGPPFCWSGGSGSSSASQLYPPRHLDLPHLPALQLPPSLSALSAPIGHKSSMAYGSSSSGGGGRERSISPASSCSQVAARRDGSNSNSPELVVASSASSSITQRSDEQHPARGASPSVSSERVSVSDSGAEQPAPGPSQPRRRRPSQPQQTSSSRQSSRSRAEKHSSSSTASVVQVAGVVFDVACCDGPVRFHRVLNENYAPNAVQSPPSQQPQRAIPPECNGRGSSCREAELPLAGCRENDENEASQQQEAGNNNPESRSGSYTCGYCQHTFKSQYCYRKHARRHLLPTDSENSSGSTVRQLLQPQPQPQPQPSVAAREAAPPDSKKREVRLLDLNVQYYPCKICGSKFPSYYFVHKHRKLCHANIDEGQGRSAADEQRMKQQQQQQQQQQQEQQQQQQQQQPSTSENAQQPV